MGWPTESCLFSHTTIPQSRCRANTPSVCSISFCVDSCIAYLQWAFRWGMGWGKSFRASRVRKENDKWRERRRERENEDALCVLSAIDRPLSRDSDSPWQLCTSLVFALRRFQTKQDSLSFLFCVCITCEAPCIVALSSPFHLAVASDRSVFFGSSVAAAFRDLPLIFHTYRLKDRRRCKNDPPLFSLMSSYTNDLLSLL